MLQLKELVIHYHLSDGVHALNARLFNQCEAKALSIIEQILETLEIDLDIELIVRNEGGIRDILIGKPKTNIDRAVLTWINPLLTAIMATVITSANYSAQIEQLHQTNIALQEQVALLRAQNEEQIAIQRQTLETLNRMDINLNKLSNNTNAQKEIRKKQSVFYKQLADSTNISAISVEEKEINGRIYEQISSVNRDNFTDFILEAGELPPIEDKDAVIKIISPVLNENGKYKWRGEYNGEIIDFYMTDREFRRQILAKEIKFGANDSMSVVLVMNRKINEIGDEVITSYSVPLVLGYEYDNGAFIETANGRERRAQDNVLYMDFGENGINPTNK